MCGGNSQVDLGLASNRTDTDLFETHMAVCATLPPRRALPCVCFVAPRSGVPEPRRAVNLAFGRPTSADLAMAEHQPQRSFANLVRPDARSCRLLQYLVISGLDQQENPIGHTYAAQRAWARGLNGVSCTVVTPDWSLSLPAQGWMLSWTLPRTKASAASARRGNRTTCSEQFINFTYATRHLASSALKELCQS